MLLAFLPMEQRLHLLMGLLYHGTEISSGYLKIIILVIDAVFSTPHFITLLIEHGFIKHDVDIPVLREPIYVTDTD